MVNTNDFEWMHMRNYNNYITGLGGGGSRGSGGLFIYTMSPAFVGLVDGGYTGVDVVPSLALVSPATFSKGVWFALGDPKSIRG